MSIKIIGGNFSGNGRDGIRVEGAGDIEISHVTAEGNGGQGINIIQHGSIMQRFGLPIDTDPKELANLLIAIRSVPENKKESVIKDSNLWGKFGVGALNTSTLISNLISIATNPQTLQMVTTLLK
ncbi:hypothetical protein ACM3N8_01755 [Aeromonas sp. A04]|uniref:hypothetical protein n=1 Tax=Aeromonas sp. A04 TaxID=3398359 RepID=UPI0039F71E39